MKVIVKWVDGTKSEWANLRATHGNVAHGEWVEYRSNDGMVRRLVNVDKALMIAEIQEVDGT